MNKNSVIKIILGLKWRGTKRKMHFPSTCKILVLVCFFLSLSVSMVTGSPPSRTTRETSPYQAPCNPESCQTDLDLTCITKPKSGSEESSGQKTVKIHTHIHGGGFGSGGGGWGDNNWEGHGHRWKRWFNFFGGGGGFKKKRRKNKNHWHGGGGGHSGSGSAEIKTEKISKSEGTCQCIGGAWNENAKRCQILIGEKCGKKAESIGSMSAEDVQCWEGSKCKTSEGIGKRCVPGGSESSRSPLEPEPQSESAEDDDDDSDEKGSTEGFENYESYGNSNGGGGSEEDDDDDDNGKPPKRRSHLEKCNKKKRCMRTRNLKCIKKKKNGDVPGGKRCRCIGGKWNADAEVINPPSHPAPGPSKLKGQCEIPEGWHCGKKAKTFGVKRGKAKDVPCWAGTKCKTEEKMGKICIAGGGSSSKSNSDSDSDSDSSSMKLTSVAIPSVTINNNYNLVLSESAIAALLAANGTGITPSTSETKKPAKDKPAKKGKKKKPKSKSTTAKPEPKVGSTKKKKASEEEEDEEPDQE